MQRERVAEQAAEVVAFLLWLVIYAGIVYVVLSTLYVLVLLVWG